MAAAQTEESTAEGGSQTLRATPWVLIVAILGSALGFIDATAVNTALPSVQRDLHASAAEITWIVEGYAVFLAALLLPGGALGDRFGRRNVFLAGIIVFALASLACGFAPNIFALNAARAVQGIGAALITPGSLALLSAAYSGAERGRAIGLWSGFGAMTGAIGPVLGGWLVQAASWRMIFFLNIPICIAIVLLARLHVAETVDHDVAPPDIPGAILITGSLGSLTFGCIRLQENIAAVDAYAFAAAGLLALGIFAVVESASAAPMVPGSIFQSRTFTIANVYTFVLYAALGGSLYFVPFNLQNVQGYSPRDAGAAMLPMIVIMFALSRWSGGLVSRFGVRLPLATGALLAAFAFCLYAVSGVGKSYWETFFPASCVLGLGAAFFAAPLTTVVMSSLDERRAGLASGVNNAVSRIAGLLAIAILGIVLSQSFFAVISQREAHLNLQPETRRAVEAGRERLATGYVPEAIAPADRPAVEKLIRSAYAQAFENVMLGSAGLCLFAAILTCLGLKTPPELRPRLQRKIRKS